MSIKIKDGREELWQWDTERFLTVSDDVDFVHFSNLQYGNAFTSEVINGEARIPDELLQAHGHLYSYIFKGSVENGYTEFSEQFEIKKKPKPVDYVFTPTEYITIESLDKRVEKLEKQGGGGGSGFSPTVEIVPIDGGHKVIITDINGKHEFTVLDGKKGDKGDKGDNYVLTESDKQEIAGMIPIPDIPESDGTTDYTQLENKPKINGVELNGDLTPEQLGLNVGGGSDEEFKLVASVTLEEDVHKITLNLPTPVTEVYVRTRTQAVRADEEEITTNTMGYFRLNDLTVLNTYSSVHGAKKYIENFYYAIATGGGVVAFKCLMNDAINAGNVLGTSVVNTKIPIINSVGLSAPYFFVSGAGDVGRIATGSSMEVWAR